MMQNTFFKSITVSHFFHQISTYFLCNFFMAIIDFVFPIFRTGNVIIFFFIQLEQLLHRDFSCRHCSHPGLSPGVSIYLNVLKIILHLKKINSATIVYLVQDLEKTLFLCTSINLQFIGFKPKSSCSVSSGPV